jgi:flagellar motor protein MotB
MALGSRPAASGEDLVNLSPLPANPVERRGPPAGTDSMEQTGGRQAEQLEQTIVGIRREMLEREAAILERVAREEKDDRDLAAELRDTVADLEEKLAARDASVLDRFAREQEASRSAVEELQETIAVLRSEVARRDSAEPAGQDAVDEIRETLAELRSEIARGDSAGSGDNGKQILSRESAGDRKEMPAAAAPPSLPPDEQSEGSIIAILGGGIFSSSQDVISGEIREAVEKVLPAIVAHPDHRIVVEGHADSVPIGDKLAGRVVDNRALSLRRAEKVALLLVEEGVLRERITVYGRGDSRPLAPNSTPEGRAENRRVEIRLVSPGAP